MVEKTPSAFPHADAGRCLETARHRCGQSGIRWFSFATGFARPLSSAWSALRLSLRWRTLHPPMLRAPAVVTLVPGSWDLGRRPSPILRCVRFCGRAYGRRLVAGRCLSGNEGMKSTARKPGEKNENTEQHIYIYIRIHILCVPHIFTHSYRDCFAIYKMAVKPYFFHAFRKLSYTAILN